VGADDDGDALSGLKVLSGSSESFLDAGFFRGGTFSGQVHSRWPCAQRVHVGLVSSHFIFFTLQVRQPVLLRVYFGRLRVTGSVRVGPVNT